MQQAPCRDDIWTRCESADSSTTIEGIKSVTHNLSSQLQIHFLYFFTPELRTFTRPKLAFTDCQACGRADQKVDEHSPRLLDRTNTKTELSQVQISIRSIMTNIHFMTMTKLTHVCVQICQNSYKDDQSLIMQQQQSKPCDYIANQIYQNDV